MSKTIALLVVALAVTGCKRTDSKKNQKISVTEDIPGKAKPVDRRTVVPAPPSVGKIPGDATRTPSGLAMLKLGKTGDDTRKPGPNDTVTVNYTAWKADGSTQYTTRGHKPQKMPLFKTGPGWTEALQKMTVGEKWRLWMTPQLAFGDHVSSKAPQDLMTYEVELLDVDPAPPVPADVAAPPAGATRTASGLAYEVLAPGTGKVHPRGFDEVQFNYTGWTTDGRLLDSTVLRKRPQTAVVFRLMPGWSEGLQTMVAGEKARFWVPEKLTRVGGGKSFGTIVFDLELLKVTPKPAPPPTPKDVAAPPANAQKTEAGVSYVVLSRGNGGEKPEPGDVATVNFTVWTTDGRLVDSSVINGKPASVPLGRVIPGWTDAMTTMTAGEKARFWIPAKLAYRGHQGPQGDLVMDMEMVSFKKKPKPPASPADVAAPPKNATRTPEGVSYVVLQKGTGTEHPGPTDVVTVDYTGWTTDGKMFDSSISSGRPATFPLNQVIKGWTIGLQTMVVGQKSRFWIPKELAYAHDPSKPQGMLVFDVELHSIKKKK